MPTESTIYAGVAGVYTVALVAFTAYQLHTLVVSFGSYPHELQLNGSYREKLAYTVAERLHLSKTFIVFAGLLACGNVVLVTLAAGVIKLLG